MTVEHTPRTWFLRVAQPLVALIDEDSYQERVGYRAQVLSAIADFLIVGGINESKRLMRGVPFLEHTKEVTAAIYNEMESKYAYAVWRAMCYTLRRAKTPVSHKAITVNWDSGCRHYNVNCKDPYFVWKYLSKNGRRLLLSYAADHTVILRPLASRHVMDMTRQLNKYSAYLVHRKLKFIWNNDAGTSADDMISELMLKGAESIRRMEFTGNENGRRHNRLHICNYAHRAMHNRAMGLIEHYTSGTRSAITCVDSGETGKRMPQYQRRVLSMDRQMSSAQPDSEHAATFHGLLETSHGAKEMLDDVFIKEIRAKFQGAAQLILSIIMDGASHPDFEAYLVSRYKQKAKALPPHLLMREACDFFGINCDLLRRTLRSMMTGEGKVFKQEFIRIASGDEETTG